MSQAWASFTWKLVLLSNFLLIAGCNGSYTAFEGDKQINVDKKTVDVETENAESLSLAALQSAYLAHYRAPLYQFLDASDLPDDAHLLQAPNTYERVCTHGGTAQYTFSRAAATTHKPGDTISVRFDNCGEGAALYNGSLSGRYTKIKGLNATFAGINTQTCLANLQQELSLSDHQVITVEGDDVRFSQVSDTLVVEVLQYIYTEVDGQLEREDIILQTLSVAKNEKAIIVNELLNRPAAAVTSENGDQLYSVKELKATRQLCQGFERTLSVTLRDFSTKIDDVTTALNGSVTLFEAQQSVKRVNQEIVNSNFQTRVIQGNLEQAFSMIDYRVQKAVNFANNSYAYLFEGSVSSPALGGRVELTSLGKLFGNFADPYPFSGSFEVKGRGLERVNLIVTNLNVRIQIDFDGDSTGNGFSDIDVFIDTTWADLFARNFQF